MAVVPVIVPSIPCPERSFISPEPVRVSMSYARRGSPTMSVKPEVRVIVPSVAWRLTEYVPAGVLGDVARTRFAGRGAWHEGGGKVKVVPEGRLMRDNGTGWAGPRVRRAVTVALA